MTNRRWTDCEAYSACPGNVKTIDNLGAVAFETLCLDPSPYTTDEKVNEAIANGSFDRLMCEITLRVGASKYLTGAQISTYMMLAGVEADWKKITPAIHKLCTLRVLRGVTLCVGTCKTMHAYALNCYGIEICVKLGLMLHKGLYRSRQERMREGYPLTDKPTDVRKVIEANNIMLRYLSAGHKTGRFDFERCLRFADGVVLNDAVFRSTLLLAFSPERSIAIDVVRRGESWIESAAEKFSRYARMAACEDFGERLVTKVITRAPVFIFCTEDAAQAAELRAAVQETVDAYGIEPLFTTDKEINGTPQLVYTLSLSGKKSLYELEPYTDRPEAC